MSISSALRVADLVAWSESWAPLDGAQSWDKVGLQLGEFGQTAERVMLCIDLTEAVGQEAIAGGANLVFAYHPLFWKPVHRLPKLAAQLCQHRIAVYCPHTAWDNAPAGINAIVAQRLGLSNTETLSFVWPAGQSPSFKLRVFVPSSHSDTLQKALFAAGAGHLHAYHGCSFSVAGQATFTASTAAQPWVGVPGQSSHVQEICLEMMVTAHRLDATLAALRRHHPYQEPCWDVIANAQPFGYRGIGLLGTVASQSLGCWLKSVKASLNCTSLMVAGDLQRSIRQVAVVVGSVGSLAKTAAERGANVLVTGELSHHEARAAQARGMAVVLLGHHSSEKLALPVFSARLHEAFPSLHACWVSTQDTDVFTQI